MTTQVDLELRALRGMYRVPKIYVIATGGAASLQSVLWSLPGASDYLVGAEFPYDQKATTALLGSTPNSFVSPSTAAQLAHAAYLKALDSSKPGLRVGLGVTCSLASEVEHRGDHRVCIVAISDTKAVQATVVLPKRTGAQARQEDDAIATTAALKCLFAVTLGADFIETPSGFVLEDAQDLCHGMFLRAPYFDADGKGWMFPEPELRKVLVPCSCNPLHVGHVSLGQDAAADLDGRFGGRREPTVPVFCVTVDAPHKPVLTAQEMLVRLHSAKGHRIWFTSGDGLYVDKADHNPGSVFAMGADALDRMLDPKWGDVEDILKRIYWRGTTFYVRGRSINGAFETVQSILTKRLDPRLLGMYGNMFRHLPGRVDISSTELRGA